VATPYVDAANVILNEFNAVSGTNSLNGGDGRDTFFGTLNGNGGNWFELMVVGDHVDMRGWRLDWTEAEQVGGVDAMGSIQLKNNSVWADLRAGSIITFIETVDAGEEGNFDTSTNTSYNPMANDWWINVSTKQEEMKGDAGIVTATTNDGQPGEFSVGNDDWQLTIRDAGGQVVFGPVGEGAGWAGGGVGNEEAGKLIGPKPNPGTPVTLATWQAITSTSMLYDDTGVSSFGALNVDYDTMTQLYTPLQDAAPLRALVGPGGQGDFEPDGDLDAADIDALSAAVRAGNNPPTYDVTSDNLVNDADRSKWVNELKKTYFGDSDLNGVFDSGDFVLVFTAGQYEDATVGNSTWATGDWDGNGDFGSGDFVKAFSEGGYDKPPRPAVGAVPEPSGALLLTMGLLAGIRRRHRYLQST
jgi:hypothetical protein